jgi:hypothetical protein
VEDPGYGVGDVGDGDESVSKRDGLWVDFLRNVVVAVAVRGEDFESVARGDA